jgi:hypothetical protein
MEVADGVDLEEGQNVRLVGLCSVQTLNTRNELENKVAEM